MIVTAGLRGDHFRRDRRCPGLGREAGVGSCLRLRKLRYVEGSEADAST